MSNKENIICPVCRSANPAPFGECFCSYDEIFHSGDWEKLAMRMGGIIKQFSIALSTGKLVGRKATNK